MYQVVNVLTRYRSCMTFLVFRYFKSKIEIYTVFIPQILFMLCIFIYLCAQIITKWLFFWVQEEYIFGRLYPGSHCAPSLLVIKAAQKLLSVFVVAVAVTVISNSRQFLIFIAKFDFSRTKPLQIGLINMFMFKDREPGFVNITNIISTEGGHIRYAEWPNCYLGQWYPGQVIDF